MTEHAAITIGLRHLDHLGATHHLGPAACIAGRKTHGGCGAAVVGAVSGNDFSLARVLMTDFDCGLVGFRSAKGNKRSGEVSGRNLSKHFSQHGPGFRGHAGRK